MNGLNDREVYLSVDEPYSKSILNDILRVATAEKDGDSVEDWLIRISQTALDVALTKPKAVQMSLVVTNDETVHRLNAQFRGLDETTDVLSFSANHSGHWEGNDEPPVAAESIEFVMPPGELSPLGEVIISYPQAERQAEEHGAPLAYELALLIVHGVLHLTGHDHLDAEETTLMQSKEATALARLNISNRK